MITYEVCLSPYQEKGVLFFDHANHFVIARDREDLEQAIFLMNTANSEDQKFLKDVKIKWP